MNTISKLDADTGALQWEFPIGNNPSEILVTPDGKVGYVSDPQREPDQRRRPEW